MRKGSDSTSASSSLTTGRSFSISCSCSPIVSVETTTRSPLRIACSAAGSRYASDLPVPVPASTSRWRPSVSAWFTASAIFSCSGRCSNVAKCCVSPPARRSSSSTSSSRTDALPPPLSGLPGVLRRREQARTPGPAAVVDTRGPLREHLAHQRRERPVCRCGEALYLVQQPARQLGQPPAQRQEDGARRVGVGVGAMAQREIDVEMLGDAAQAVIVQAGQQAAGPGRGCRTARPATQTPLRARKRRVELDVLPDDRAIADERGDLRRHGGEVRRGGQLGGMDARQALDAVTAAGAPVAPACGTRPARPSQSKAIAATSMISSFSGLRPVVSVSMAT